ncbi:hypothetical protein [Aeromonas caviae]|uniref:hypothetical protein n=1 Tax=Aeromonas caviae TaxID=648 RepID=UPI0015DBDFF4|nr:hypothetical protein [Aeromonas caviae]BBR10076.1 hypothetical protein WP3S18E02_17370 [Aeromonas caviae]
MNQRSELRQRLRQQASKKCAHGQQFISPEKILVIVQIGLALLPLITAFIYLMGMSWHQGYLLSFHVDSSEFPLSTEQTLLTGVMAVSLAILPVYIYTILAMGIAIIIWFVLTGFDQEINGFISSIKLRTIDFIEGLMLKLKIKKPMESVKKVSKPRKVIKWSEKLKRMAITYLIGTAILLLIGMVVELAWHVHTEGTNLAKNQKTMLSNNTLEQMNIILYNNNKKPALALRIICNTTQCAFWTEDDGTIYLRHEQIDSATIPSKIKYKQEAS